MCCKENICMISYRWWSALEKFSCKKGWYNLCREFKHTNVWYAHASLIDRERSDYSPYLVTAIQQFLVLRDIDK